MNKRLGVSIGLLISIFIISSFIGITSTQVCAQEEKKTITIKLNDGMEAEIDPIGRNKSGSYEFVTVSLTLCNRGEKTFYLAHIGPAKAQDNAGGVYTVYTGNNTGISGVFDDYQWAIRSKEDKINRIQQFTRIDAKTNATITFTLASQGKSRGPLMSFATVFVARSVDSPIADKTISDEKKIKDLYQMNVSFRSIPVNDAE